MLRDARTYFGSLTAAVISAGIVFAGSGCTRIVASKLDDKPRIVDDCTDEDDGTWCGEGQICVEGLCEASTCGDGLVDPRDFEGHEGEPCDDGNDVFGDGCEEDCTFSCEHDEDCNDENVCTPETLCDTESHTCELAVEPTPTSEPPVSLECFLDGGDPGICRFDECVALGCGDGIEDPDEQCDDGNVEDGDGCDNDCTFSCEEDADCQDGNLCNGEESCTSHVCEPGEPVVCDAVDDPCSENLCIPEKGVCETQLIDGDGDGFGPDPACGGDCNDDDETIHPQAQEVCGDEIDNDCNEMTRDDDAETVYHIDCDGDDYARSTVGATEPLCDPPSTPPQGCSGSNAGWTSRIPAGTSSTDCNDDDASINPRHTTFETTVAPGVSPPYDWNCSGIEEQRWTATDVSTSALCTGGLFIGCAGTDGWTGSFVPRCGASASFSDCRSTLVFDPKTGGLEERCSRATITQRQACR